MPHLALPRLVLLCLASIPFPVVLSSTYLCSPHIFFLLSSPPLLFFSFLHPFENFRQTIHQIAISLSLSLSVALVNGSIGFRSTTTFASKKKKNRRRERKGMKGGRRDSRSGNSKNTEEIERMTKQNIGVDRSCRNRLGKDK